MSKKITLFGHGYIGTAIAKYLTSQGQDFYWYHHNENLVIMSNVIINASGYTGFPNVEGCESHKEETIDGNIIWPMEIERRSQYIPVIHLSSACVYDGYKLNGKGWTEEDSPNFNKSFYSLTKRFVQQKLDLKNNYLLRIRMPFAKDNSDRNYLNKLRKYPKLIDGENSLSCLDDVVRVVLFFAQTFPEPGIYNVCNEGHIGAKEIADMMGLQKEWFTREEFDKFVSTPRSFTTLNTDKLQKIFPIRDVREAIKSCL